MHWSHSFEWAVALMSIARGSCAAAAADSTVYHDSETGFTFSQYAASYNLNGGNVFFRIAVPSSATAGTAYDAVVQVAAPMDSQGWSGLAWGGEMTNNPLTVVWPYGNNVQLSSRYATAHVAPSIYSGATYEVFKTGTHVNSSHWQITAKCTGCTSVSSVGVLNPKGTHRLAFAWASNRPTNPSSSSSPLVAHDIYGYWNHDFSQGGNTAFTSLVAKNSGSSGSH